MGFKRVYLVSEGEHEDEVVWGIFSTFDRAYTFYKSIFEKNRTWGVRIIRYPLDYLVEWPESKTNAEELIIDSHVDGTEHKGV